MTSLIASHRGGALQWPENSATSFRNTTALAVEQVEFDIHPTADGEVVVIHDALLDRTTDGTGPVVARTLAELRRLTLKGTASDRILTLAEVAEIFAPTAINLRMEVKYDAQRRPYPGLLAKALAILDAAGMRARTVVTSFLAETATAAATIPGIDRAIWIVSPDVQDYLGLRGVVAVARDTGVHDLAIRQNRLDADIIATLRSQGFGIGAWAVNDDDAIRKVLGLGVDVFTSDIPSRALELRAG
jgi:glycerophosphoryl diester phosphodiesterase